MSSKRLIFSLSICLLSFSSKAQDHQNQEVTTRGSKTIQTTESLTSNEKILIEDLTKQLEICDLHDFLLKTEFTDALKFPLNKELNQEDVKQLALEFFRFANRQSKLYSPNPTVTRPQSQNTFNVLLALMKKRNVSTIKPSSFQKFAQNLIFDAKAKGLLGECYPLLIKEHTVLASYRTIAIPAQIQNAIDSLFKIDSSFSTPFTENENRILQDYTFTKDEILELRAIRKATEIFEKNTLLAKDEAGGFWTNLKGEIFGNNQLSCTEEAETYYQFLLVLKERGLLKKFSPLGKKTITPPISKDWSNGGHVATLLSSNSNQRQVILDSWYEKGGSAAHLLMLEDWQQLPISSFRKIHFKDIVPILPDN